MCSVQVSDLEDRQGTMILGEKQYIFPEDRNVVTLVMLHHPMPWFLDRADAKTFLQDRSSILLTGHEHLSELSKITALNELERIEISAGAITDNKADAPFEFAYNLLELDMKQDDHVFLSLTIWPRIMRANTPRFAPDASRTGGPDSRTLSINCGVTPVPAEPSNVHSEGALEQEGATMQRDDTADFGRLKHFFWHYLTWEQRISVLVRADVLPQSAENRLPQTIELNTLLRAKESGKLALVWDMIMSFVPPEKQKDNPF